MHFPHLKQAARVVLTATAALFTALLIIYVVLSIRAQGAKPPVSKMGTTFNDQDKLALLAALAATSTPDIQTRTRILNKLPESPKQPSREEKLKILQSLQAKP